MRGRRRRKKVPEVIVMRNNELYDIKDEKLERKRKNCPKCEGAFLARHSDRLHCGRCGYTEFLNKE